MIRIIIADDETHARERLRELLDRFGIFEIVAEASDGNEALQQIITHKVDVAFLDINMPGIPVFQTVSSLQHPPLIVFQTAYSEHAAEAFEIDALDYLLKPVRYERLEKTVEKIRSRLLTNDSTIRLPDTIVKPSDHITITIHGKTRVIQSSEIIRISLDKQLCYVYTNSEKLISDKYLSYYEERLDSNVFFRTSRNDIINLNYITIIHKELQNFFTIGLKNGMNIELSRRRAQELRKLIDF
ncbi:MAG: LytR/AlgR family response regulator transcription factor [Fibrobacterota bacterium]|nr:response regulator transcription factor [Chitinispirillaceae bacterium]